MQTTALKIYHFQCVCLLVHDFDLDFVLSLFNKAIIHCNSKFFGVYLDSGICTSSVLTGMKTAHIQTHIRTYMNTYDASSDTYTDGQTRACRLNPTFLSLFFSGLE